MRKDMAGENYTEPPQYEPVMEPLIVAWTEFIEAMGWQRRKVYLKQEDFYIYWQWRVFLLRRKYGKTGPARVM